METDLIYTGGDLDNWFYDRYYYAGVNSRYHTFQLVLNLLYQKHANPTIIETGCQRLKDDLGGGMSTSIWAEYIQRYGGKLISVDNSVDSLQAARRVLQEFSGIDVTLVHSDSVVYLEGCQEHCDLLYLDSFDYPIVKLCEIYGGHQDIDLTMKIMNQVGRDRFIDLHRDIILPCQEHCLKEFQAIESNLPLNCILLIDDNQLPGGGKPRLLKDYLWARNEWTCLLDFQNSVWVKEI